MASVMQRQECSHCPRGNTGDCDLHQIPPVCICDEPGEFSGCERCDRHYVGVCHNPGCHRPYGPRFAEVRAAWVKHLHREMA